ncbi:uncharacterized protein DUF2637 [Nonomuraea fuscirosea]|uniref:Uncharacterized protein DUF2637 n=1 Tax=Nonomuraea fuscirosea TaxID=1291556 RepID=A0A2T0LZP7_9ACTN|nr:DUF2637 domain-containing protein [Nonomuraea fuscirosea]PRX49702.1 uncharacterized protein DUF2637 [Nonomuraea fuscirosea]
MNRLRSMVVDSAPVTVLALIAAVGSFDHISSLARKYGQLGWRAWAVAVCIDLLCVMAAREIQRDKRTGRRRRGLLSWPALVLSGGIVLTLAANLAEAPQSAWGWILAATPAGAFLIAMSMLERRASRPDPEDALEIRSDAAVPAHGGSAQRVHSARVDEHEQLVAASENEEPPQLEQAPSVPAAPDENAPVPAPALLGYARRLATEYEATHSRPIPAEVLRARMNVAPELAAGLLDHLGLGTD